MKNRFIFFSTCMALVFLVAASWAEAPWEILARSEGGLETAALSAAGDVLIQEQLRFNRLNSAGEAAVQDLSVSERVFLSPNAGTYAIISYEGSPEQPEAASLTLKRTDGSTLWNLQHQFLNDIYPSDFGAAVAVARNNSVLDNRIYFCSIAGKLVKEITLPAVGEVSFSSSGDRVLINSGVEGLLLFDDRGNRLVELGSAHGFKISPDGRWTAVLYGPKLTLFHNGRPSYVGEPSGEILRGVAFSKDNAHLAVFSSHALVVLENPAGTVVMQKHLEVDGQFSFTSVDLALEAGCIAAGLERDLGSSVQGPERHPDGMIRLYNRDGSACYEKTVDYRHWNITTPRVSFSPDGKRLVVLTRDEIICAPLGSLCCEGGAK
jgi:hypothetical protein